MSAIEMIESAPTVLELESQPAALPVVQPQAQARQLSVVEYAMQNGASPADVRALVELQIQMDNHKLALRKQDDERERELRAERARNAFFAAMAALKAEHIRVVRNVARSDGPLKGQKYADLFAVTDAAVEAMSKHGLSHKFEPAETESKDWIKIICHIRHVDGYSEPTTFEGPVDTGPGRNAMQSRKSSVTYLERITLSLALGLAEQGADDDGAGGAVAVVSEQILDGLIVDLEATKTDAEAAALWASGSKALAATKNTAAYEEFKGLVVAHRKGLKAKVAQ